LPFVPPGLYVRRVGGLGYDQRVTRIAVVADLHANLAAFEAVIAAWGEVDEVWCLGDVVGYGPDPNECVARLREMPHVCLPGNHDWAALGRIDTDDFNPVAKAAAEWTAAVLSTETRAYLEGLSETLTLEPFTLVHGSPRSPIWEYLLDASTARTNFDLFSTDYCLIGHSHVPLTFSTREDGRIDARLLVPEGPFELIGARRFLNPGSVGQPRDGDPRASFAIVELREEGPTFELIRVDYPIEETQARMQAIGLPDPLIQRLAVGR
jgi:diadenosine tetraphosphatase ApaH/serine/threonine PP2A family protein phosphatase